MAEKKFEKWVMQGLASEDYDPDEFEIVEDEIVGTSRWTNTYEMVFKEVSTGKYYRTSYSRGATECQDESPYEFESCSISVTEVKPVEVSVTQFVAV